MAMMSTHVLNRGGKRACRSVDWLWELRFIQQSLAVFGINT